MSLLAGPSNEDTNPHFSNDLSLFELVEDPEGVQQRNILSAHFGLSPFPSEVPEDEVETDVCKNWQEGNCTKGEKCRFKHGVVNKKKRKSKGGAAFGSGWLTNLAMAQRAEITQKVSNDHDQEDDEAPNPVQELVVEDRDQALEKMFQELGNKRRQEQSNEQVPDATTKEVADAEASSSDNEGWDVVDSDKEERSTKRSSPEIVNIISKEELEIRHMKEAETIEQYIVLQSSMVTCGAGLEIRQVIPGYDLRQLLIKNLPLDTTREEIEAILLAYDEVTKLDFFIFDVKESRDGRSVHAIIITGARHGSALVDALNGTALRNRNLIFEVCANATWTSGSMEVNQPTLTLSWNVPGQGARGIETFHFERNVSGLYERLYQSTGVQMDTSHLDADSGASDGTVTLTVDFDNWENLQTGVREMEKNRPQISSLRITHPQAQQYSLSIPQQQFRAQTKQWTSMAETKTPRAPAMTIDTTGHNVTVHVSGKDRSEIGALKVRAERLASGEILDGVFWHPSFAIPEDSDMFFDEVRKATRADLRPDPPIRAIRLFGEPQQLEKAQQMVRDEAHRRAQVKTRTALNDQTGDFFVREGIGRLQELVGEENVDFTITSKWTAIMMRGGDEATHHLERLLMEACSPTLEDPDDQGVDALDTCPVCFSDALNSETLGCGHKYCAGCLSNFLAAAGNNKTFPILCMGNEGKCNTPVSLPFLQRFLPHQPFKTLVEAAFANYLERNPQEFRYCRTPDCRQTYRKQPEAQASGIQCPSCFAAFCSACEQDHPRMNCREYRLSRDVAEQERLNGQLAQAQGYRRCPRCAVWIEKIAGCNHMTCKCGAHICWVCLGIFPVGQIYQHIRTAHGQ